MGTNRSQPDECEEKKFKTHCCINGGSLANEEESLATSIAKNCNIISVTELWWDNWPVQVSDYSLCNGGSNNLKRKKAGRRAGSKSNFVQFLGKMKLSW